MKKWNKPEIMMIGIENTMTQGNGNSNGGPGHADTHYCHATGKWEGTANGEGDHNASGKNSSGQKVHYWTGNICETHDVAQGATNGAGNHACCCLS